MPEKAYEMRMVTLIMRYFLKYRLGKTVIKNAGRLKNKQLLRDVKIRDKLFKKTPWSFTVMLILNFMIMRSRIGN